MFKTITTDVKAALINRIEHITSIKIVNGKFTGCHSKIAIDKLGSRARIEVVTPPNSLGVYEARVFAKSDDGIEIMKSGYDGISTFYPDGWDEARILNEAEYAIRNNKGLLVPTDPKKGYWGYARDGKIKIGFYYNDTDGYIASFFPLLK